MRFCRKASITKEGSQIDDYCILSIDDDYIYAVLTLLPYRPEDYQVPIQDIIAELKRVDVRFGIRKENVEKAAQISKENPDTRLDLILAQGRRPIDGTDTEINFCWSTSSRKEVVRKGDMLIEKRVGKQWKDGRNILGRVLKAKRGDEITLIPGDGVIVSEDGLSIYAKEDGVVHWDDGHIWITPEDRDGYVTIETSPDLLSATASFFPPSGKGKPLSSSNIITELFNAGITYGIQRETIVQGVDEVQETGEPQLDILIAKGRPAEKGRDGRGW